MSIDSLIQEVNKKYGAGTLKRASDPSLEKARIPTGILAIDYLLGGGFMRGRSVEIYGQPALGKSALTLRTLASAQRMGEGTAYFDSEACVSGEMTTLDPVSGFYGRVKDYLSQEGSLHNASYTEGKIRISRVQARVRAGILPTISIKTTSTEVVCSQDHPVLIWRHGGPYWTQAGDVSPGEHVARLRHVSIDSLSSSCDITTEQAEMVGLLLGDGSTPSKGSFRFHNADQETLERANHLASLWDCRLKHVSRVAYSIIHSERRGAAVGYGGNPKPNPLKEWYRDRYGLGVTALDKKVPSDLMVAPLDTVGHLLSGLWMTDGTVNQVRPTTYLSTSSTVMAHQVRWLLARGGIHSSLYKGPDANWRVSINGRGPLEVFRNWVPLYSYKRERLDRWLTDMSSRRGRHPRGYLLPGYRNSNHYRKRHEWENTSDVWWDKVVSVDDVGFQECFDASVPDGQSWMVNDVVVHNTLHQGFAKHLGVDLDKLTYHRQRQGNQLVDLIEVLLRSREYGVIVIDSIASLIPIGELESDMEKTSMGMEQAKMMSKALRKLTTANDNTVLIWLNQVRENAGAMSLWAPKWRTSGGRAMAFYASTRLELSKTESIKRKMKIADPEKGEIEKDVIRGHRISINVTKEKTGGAKIGDIATTVFSYDLKDFDPIEDLIYVGLQTGYVMKTGNTWRISEREFSGRARAKRGLREDPALAEGLRACIETAMVDGRRGPEESEPSEPEAGEEPRKRGRRKGAGG